MAAKKTDLTLKMAFLGENLLVKGLKGHRQLWDRADLDTSFLTLKKVHFNLKSKKLVECI